MPQTFSDNTEITELRVAGSTPSKELAASIIHLLNDEKRVRLAAIGHQAVGQAVKAIPVVNQYCVAQGYLVGLLPSFSLMEVLNRDTELPDSVGSNPPSQRTNERTITMMTLVRFSPQ